MEQENKQHFIRLYYSNQSGASLIFVLMTSFLLITLVTIVIRFSNTDIRSAAKHENQTEAYYIAEAGLEEATYMVNKRLEEGLEPPTSLPITNFQDGTYEVAIQKKLNEYNEKIGYDIISIGKFKGEEKTLTSWVREPIWNPEDSNPPDPLSKAIFSYKDINIQTFSPILSLHEITITGNVHGNNYVTIQENGTLSKPTINDGYVSSTNISKITIEGNSHLKRQTSKIPMPQFDFDYARKKAIELGTYFDDENKLNISLLGLLPPESFIFIEGDLTTVGLDLLGINIRDRTFVVNGSINGAVSLGGSIANLNLIAKKDITFAGLLTGLQVKGVLFSQEGKVETSGHTEVEGYVGGYENVDIGGGLLSGVLGILTGDLEVKYNPEAFKNLPSGIGFKQNKVELIEQKESADNVEE